MLHRPGRLSTLPLQDDTGRRMGLHGRAADDAAKPDHRRAPAGGHRAGAEERVLLRPGPDHGRVHLGRGLRRRRNLGVRRRSRDRSPYRDAGGALRDEWARSMALAGPGGRGQLAPVLMESGDEARLPPDAEQLVVVRPGHGRIPARAVEHRHGARPRRGAARAATSSSGVRSTGWSHSTRALAGCSGSRPSGISRRRRSRTRSTVVNTSRSWQEMSPPRADVSRCRRWQA